MNQPPFPERVRHLRQTWAERRLVRAFAGVRGFAPQLEFLGVMHGWAMEIADSITTVYGEELPARLSPPPTGDEPSFRLDIGPGYSLVAAVTRQTRARLPVWSIIVSTHAAGVGPDGGRRRTGHWTRARLEEAVLSLLVEYERSRGTTART